MQTESSKSSAPLVAIDTEVSGSGAAARVVQIGAVVLDTGDEFVSLVAPELQLTAEAQARTGLSNARLALANGPHQVFTELINWLDSKLGPDYILIAHNANFDARAISATLAAAGPAPSPELRAAERLLYAKLACSMNYFRNKRDYGGTLSLDALHLKLIGVPIQNRAPYHDALVDARALVSILKTQKDLEALSARAHSLDALGRLKSKRRKPVEIKFSSLTEMLEYRCEQQKVLDELEAQQEEAELELASENVSINTKRSEALEALRKTEEHKKLTEEKRELDRRLTALYAEAISDLDTAERDTLNAEVQQRVEKMAETKSRIRRVETRIGHMDFAETEHDGYCIRRRVNPKSFVRMEQLEAFMDEDVYRELVDHFDKNGLEVLPLE